MTTETSLSELEVLEPRARLLRDLRTTPHGLSAPEAERRLVQSGRERVAPPQRLAMAR